MALRWTCNAPEEPLDGRETARKVWLAVHLALSKVSCVSAFLIAPGKRAQTLTSLGKEPTPTVSCHPFLQPVVAILRTLTTLRRANDTASHFSSNNIFQLTFSQASVFILYGFFNWIMNQALVQTLSLGSLQTNKTSSVTDRYILSL